MSEPMTFQKKSRRERYIVRDDVSTGSKRDACETLDLKENPPFAYGSAAGFLSARDLWGFSFQ